jgi:hypothetical protein
MTARQVMTDTEFLTAIEGRGLSIGWESSDDPFVRHHIATRRNGDGDATRSKFSVKFRGPVKDALAVCIIAEREGLVFAADVWSPDFLASRGLPHRGYPRNNPADYATTHPAKTQSDLADD